MPSKESNSQVVSPTSLTLTLPTLEGDTLHATLLVQRGEWGQMRQITFSDTHDLAMALQSAVNDLSDLENDPPTVPQPVEVKPTKAAPSKPSNPGDTPPTEPTLPLHTKKGVVEVPISFVKIVAGETDAAAYGVAVKIAGRLLDSQLWDGKTPLRLRDVYQVQATMKHLSDRDFALFQLSDFADIAAHDTLI